MRVVGERHTLFVDFSSLLAVSFSYQGKWLGRLSGIQLRREAFHKRDARFLEALVREVAPAVYYMHHLSRLRSRARATERSRIAHELHDGVIQSLIGMEMQTDAVRRQASGDPHALLKEINRLQELLRKEILDLRGRMQLLKPIEVEPAQLVHSLAETVDRFRREQSISASFVSDSQEVSLPPRVCSELVRILQEALVNIRKHSGPQGTGALRPGKRNVEAARRGRRLRLRIYRSTIACRLEAAFVGPLSYQGARALDRRELVIESVPGRGARLEISLPPGAHEQAA